MTTALVENTRTVGYFTGITTFEPVAISLHVTLHYHDYGLTIAADIPPTTQNLLLILFGSI